MILSDATDRKTFVVIAGPTRDMNDVNVVLHGLREIRAGDVFVDEERKTWKALDNARLLPNGIPGLMASQVPFAPRPIQVSTISTDQHLAAIRAELGAS